MHRACTEDKMHRLFRSFSTLNIRYRSLILSSFQQTPRVYVCVCVCAKRSVLTFRPYHPNWCPPPPPLIVNLNAKTERVAPRRASPRREKRPREEGWGSCWQRDGFRDGKTAELEAKLGGKRFSHRPARSGGLLVHAAENSVLCCLRHGGWRTEEDGFVRARIFIAQDAENTGQYSRYGGERPEDTPSVLQWSE